MTRKDAPGPNAFLRWLARVLARGWHRLPPGRYPLPQGPVILAGNHRCGLDPVIVQAAVDRPVRFIMAREYYDRLWWLRWMFDAAGVVLVGSVREGAHALLEAEEALQKGHVIGIFPEGAANPPRPLARILPGAVYLAAATRAPIIPFRIGGVWPFDHRHMWTPILRRSRAWIRFGAPLRFAFDPKDREAIAKASEKLRQAILEIPRTRPARIG